MIKKVYNGKIWKSAQTFVIFGIVICVCILVAAIFLPIDTSIVQPGSNVSDTQIDASDSNQAMSVNIDKIFRDGLFKSSSLVDSKPLADKTIEDIVSKLKLQCVMAIGDKATAYIYVKGEGLKKCQVGDSVGNMFSVLDVGKDCADISIVGHKITLTK